MEWSGNEKDVEMEYQMCFTYEKDQKKDECCGASGRKMRKVCIYCPNYRRYLQRKDKERENKDHEKGD